jgi:hypothetical protein
LEQDDYRAKSEYKADALVGNFAFYREVVNQYNIKHLIVGSIPFEDLELPEGWINMRDWKNIVTVSDTNPYLRHCFVYGEATSEERTALLKRFRYMSTIGWNDNGIFVRNGSAIALPEEIPNNAIVSVTSALKSDW